jgi:hypothetical protein
MYLEHDCFAETSQKLLKIYLLIHTHRLIDLAAACCFYSFNSLGLLLLFLQFSWPTPWVLPSFVSGHNIYELQGFIFYKASQRKGLNHQ